jgi:ABC-type thiamin/hydroxymethylpyrimidine transport system permease subunit
MLAPMNPNTPNPNLTSANPTTAPVHNDADHAADTAKSVRMPVRPDAGWSLRSVIAVVLVSLVTGALFSPLLIRAVGLMRTGMPLSDVTLVSAFANLLLLPSFIGAATVRRFGAAILAQSGMAVALAVLTPFPADVLLSCLVLAVLSEVVVALSTRYHNFSIRRMLAAGVLAGIPALGLNVFGHSLTLAPAEALMLTLASLGSATLAAWAGGFCAKLIRSERHPNSAD